MPIIAEFKVMLFGQKGLLERTALIGLYKSLFVINLNQKPSEIIIVSDISNIIKSK